MIIFYVCLKTARQLAQHYSNRSHNIMNYMNGLLRDRLHWLCVPEPVGYKLCLLVFKAVHNTSPDYLRELCRSNVLYSGQQHMVISRFHVRRPTLVISVCSCQASIINRVGKYRDIFENIEKNRKYPKFSIFSTFSIFLIYIKHLHIHW